jgi:hypothetical protein
MDGTLHQTIESGVGVTFFVAVRPAEDAGGESDHGLEEKSDEQAFIEEETQKLLKMFEQEKSKLHARYVAERKAGYGA